jgi:hypothetical protein
MSNSNLPFKPTFADSHVTELPNCYVDHIDPAYPERAPHTVWRGEVDLSIVENVMAVPVSLAAWTGVDPKDRNACFLKYSELHNGGWDTTARLADQDRNGIAAEIIYPTVGMTIYGNPDTGFQHACVWAYNRWLQNFCSAAPKGVCGVEQTALLTDEERRRIRLGNVNDLYGLDLEAA